MEQSSYPACVGLGKVGKYGRVHEVWNDTKGSRPTPWYMRFIPMKYIKQQYTRLSKIFGERIPTVFSEEEQLNTTRIFKSKTPKYDLSWYIKWIASLFIVFAMSVRGMVDYIYYDMVFSMIGLILWTWVSILWNDRALIMLNVVGFFLVLRNFLNYLAGV